MEILVSVVGSVAGKIVEYAVEPIRRQFDYVISYGSIIQSLKEEVKRLDDQISGVQQLVDTEGRNLRDPMPVVQTWLEQARGTSEEIGRFLDTEVARVGNGRCLNGWCPDLKARRSVSRKAKKKTPAVVQLVQNGSFSTDQIACPPPPLRLVSTLTMTTQAFQDFESRVIIMDKVLEALKDDNVNMIRICGAGGVGKTTMANKIVNKVKEAKLFDEVAMVVVSQTLDPKKMRDVISDQLGLKLDQQSEEGRAAQLHARIVKCKKFLLVLDDVWDEIQFADIGLPSGLGGAVHRGNKILFTSRREDVFLTSGIIRSPTNFVVPTLSEEEAWSLFYESAGNCCEAPCILPIAKLIVDKCGGLPIAIVTVGNTLRVAGSNKHEWSDALRELERGRHGNRAYSCIKLSYNYLKCEELQGFFLLCCLFPEDADISVEVLLRYGMGLGLLTKDNYSIEGARNRVHTLICKLRRLFLLLDSKEPGHVRMHDVVRDVGISIASEDKENGLMNTCKYYENSDEVFDEHAGRFDFTKLKLLWLSKLQPAGISLNFFEGMKKLNVLALSEECYCYYTQPILPPLQLHVLENIQTLCLEYYNFCDIDLSDIGALRNLEILSFYGSFGIVLPSKLGLLTRLRLLDCTNTSVIPLLKISFGVLTGLKRLENLYLGNNKVKWEMEEEGKEAVNARIAEFRCLSNLTALAISLPKVHLIDPKALHFEKLVRFWINMGCDLSRCWEKKDYEFINTLAIGLKGEERIDPQMVSLLNTLLKTTEFLYVQGGTWGDLNYDMDGEENLIDFLQMSLKKGFTGPSPSFSHLQHFEVHYCSTLKYVLPLNVATSLLQLKSLNVNCCNVIEEVFHLESSNSKSRDGEGEGATGHTVKLPELSSLKLHFLPKLTAFCRSAVEFELPQLMSLELSSLDSVKSLATSMWQLYNAENLRVLKVDTCPDMEELFDPEKVNNVEQGKLENATNTILPRLEELHISFMTKMKHVWKNSTQAQKGFQSLQILCVYNSDNMEHIIGEGEEEDNEGAVNVLFPQLVKLELVRLQDLISFSSGNKYPLDWMRMKEVVLDGCPNMKTFSSGIVDHTGITSHRPFFNEDVKSVNLEIFEINRMGCEIIWHCRTQAFVGKMKMSYCHKLKNVLASSSDGIKMVKSLEVSMCDSLESVFQFDCERIVDAAILSNGLKVLELSELPKLTNVCNMGLHDHNPSHVIIEAALTKDLKKLILYKCPSLQHVFSLSTTARSVVFPQLYNLDIRNCLMMEEILVKIEAPATSEMTNTSKVLFPELKHLSLMDNANLKMIVKGIDACNATEFSIESVSICECPKLGPSSSYFSLLNSQELQHIYIKFELQKVYMSYDPEWFMLIDGVENLMDLLILNGKSQPLYLSRINSVELRNLSNFPGADWLHFLQSLPKLEKLHISGCGSVELMFGLDQGLNVKNLPQLTALKLEKLTCIWMNDIPRILSQRFQKLRELHVGQCHSLRNLLTPSMVKYLPNLTMLTVENCSLLNEIVSLEEELATECRVIEDEGEEINNGTIEFPQVRDLTLKNLPNLTSFCANQGYTFNWPSLTKVVVLGCPILEIFTLAVPNTPMLKEVERQSNKYPMMEDLNATIRLIFEEKGSEGR